MASPVYCLYYQGCGGEAQLCGYCIIHCECLFKAMHVGRKAIFDPNKIQVEAEIFMSEEVMAKADEILDEVIRDAFPTEADQPASGESDGRPVERDAPEGRS